MSYDIIKEKINNGEGYIETLESGLIRVSELSPEETITWKPTKNDYNDINDISEPLVLKTEADYQADNIKQVQQKILNEIKPLLDSMATQQLGIDKGLDPADALYTDKEIKDWILYSNKIAKGQIDTVPPELPEAYKNIL